MYYTINTFVSYIYFPCATFLNSPYVYTKFLLVFPRTLILSLKEISNETKQQEAQIQSNLNIPYVSELDFLLAYNTK
jgi:hypothetical protein